MNAWAATCLVSLALSGADLAGSSGAVGIESVLVTLIEQVDVPARDAGVLSKLPAREGQVVEPGAVLAEMEDQEARQSVERAQLELDVARKEAANDLKVRFARKSHEVALAELQRATESVEKYKRSVSQSELDSLRLTADGAALEVEQARHDLEIAQLNCRLKENELHVVTGRLERLKIVAPLAGMVVQIKRHRGEWVEPGNPIVRVVRMDRLRAEGFLDARLASAALDGRSVTLTVELADKKSGKFHGKIVFISPEVNPVNGQVRVWAEIENPKLELRPGVQGSLVIDGAASGER